MFGQFCILYWKWWSFREVLAILFSLDIKFSLSVAQEVERVVYIWICNIWKIGCLILDPRHIFSPFIVSLFKCPCYFIQFLNQIFICIWCYSTQLWDISEPHSLNNPLKHCEHTPTRGAIHVSMKLNKQGQLKAGFAPEINWETGFTAVFLYNAM